MKSDPLPPAPDELGARARADLGVGLPVAITDENEACLAAAAERISPARLAALTADGTAQLVLTARRAETLKIRVYDNDLVRLPLPRDPDPHWLAAMIDPARDLTHPMKGPFAPVRGGDPRIPRAALALARSARILPAGIVAPAEAVPDGITRIDAATLLATPEIHLDRVVAARLPIAATTEARLHVFRPHDGREEHYAVEIGRPDRTAPVLTRLHSACYTGDVLGSLKCDCGPQLHAALHRMAEAGGGILLYLNQEGRGIGLSNKMRAYALQDQGFDTVEANHRLGFDDDERDFRLGAEILRLMNVTRVRLLTNNPRKMRMLEGSGIEIVERLPIWVGETPQNAAYLRIKATKSGHIE
ncbi:GTP cyclohydrolase II [Palleronia aestuarii]|uniref:GTP cyclohydrolase-2 n=1 Tax=Palleronia aestuarii TaxID=568105 RepID=A0A2W7NL64_9RHOB|nr:GTP cyclohydrolase II [Palleronia aestuarii]PZX18847.1 GTP cyclohydrolase II [Palleronia aestuarii]